MDNELDKYIDCRIVDIQRGQGPYAQYVYARLVDRDGNLLVCATLDYITKTVINRLPKKE